jgi:hypothetical protein
MANTRRILIKNGFANETVEIDATEAANKEIQLSQTPKINTQTVVHSINGPTQRYGADFIVTGDVLSWNGYGLETILEEGDTLVIVYPI